MGEGKELFRNMHNGDIHGNVLDTFHQFIFGEQIYCIEPIYISRYVHKAPMLFKPSKGGDT